MSQTLTFAIAQGQRFSISLRQPTPRELQSIVPFISVGGGSLRDTIGEVVEDLMGDPDHDFEADFLLTLNT